MQLCQKKRTGNLSLKNISNRVNLDQIEKSEAWQTAIGLQAVDGLKTSAYLLDTAKEHIEGKISIDEAQKRIQSYYEQRTDRTGDRERHKGSGYCVRKNCEAVRREEHFQFSPAEWLTIHRRLFEGVFRPCRSDSTIQYYEKRMGAERRYCHLRSVEQHQRYP